MLDPISRIYANGVPVFRDTVCISAPFVVYAR